MANFTLHLRNLRHIPNLIFAMNKLFISMSIVLLPVFTMAQKKDKSSTPKVFDLLIGGYTAPDGNRGITVYRFYAETGKFAFLGETETASPTFLCVSPDRKFVYSVNAVADGGVSAFSFDYNTGALKFINKQASVGANPAHITIDKDANNVIVSNYNNGTLSVLPLNKDGSVAPATQTIIGEGSSVNAERQAGPHFHSANFSPDEKHVLYADLGTDKLYIAKYKAGKIPPLVPEEIAFEKVKPGSGPRHMDFSTDGKFLYLVNEMAATVNQYAYNKGKVTFIESLDLASPGFTGRNGAADIHVSPDGRFLYATNRGTANELVVFGIDQASGKLHYLTRYPTGKEPRNFVIEPGGNFLLLAAQKDNIVNIYRIDKLTGLLVMLNMSINIPSPTVLKLVSAE
ncbi:lactonase family protein [Mucilaginibacter sp. HD30]